MVKVRSAAGPPRKQGFNRSGHSMNPERSTEGLKGVGKVRSKGTIKRLQMYRNFKAKRDKTGKILTPAPFQVSFRYNHHFFVFSNTIDFLGLVEFRNCG